MWSRKSSARSTAASIWIVGYPSRPDRGPDHVDEHRAGLWAHATSTDTNKTNLEVSRWLHASCTVQPTVIDDKGTWRGPPRGGAGRVPQATRPRPAGPNDGGRLFQPGLLRITYTLRTSTQVIVEAEGTRRWRPCSRRKKYIKYETYYLCRWSFLWQTDIIIY